MINAVYTGDGSNLSNVMMSIFLIEIAMSCKLKATCFCAFEEIGGISYSSESRPMPMIMSLYRSAASHVSIADSGHKSRRMHCVHDPLGIYLSSIM
jgi:hypothetical protein